MSVQQWTNAERTLLVRTGGIGTLYVAVRPDTDAVWGPPVQVLLESPDANHQPSEPLRRARDSVERSDAYSQPGGGEIAHLRGAVRALLQWCEEHERAQA